MRHHGCAITHQIAAELRLRFRPVGVGDPTQRECNLALEAGGSEGQTSRSEGALVTDVRTPSLLAIGPSRTVRSGPSAREQDLVGDCGGKMQLHKVPLVAIANGNGVEA